MLLELGRGMSHCGGGGDPPVNTAAPIVSGTMIAGQTLSCTAGTWTGTPSISYAYQWRRDGAAVSGATASTYVLTASDQGHAIDCNVTAANAFGSASQDSNDLFLSGWLDGLLSSVVVDLDATVSASYPGTGQTWSNLTASPADGSAQTAYDFYLGDTSSAAADDPTFNGTAGSSSAYWSFDGGDLFALKSGANTAFLNSLHKTTGGGPSWIAWAFRPIDGASTYGMFNNCVSGGNGVRVEVSAAETPSIGILGDSTGQVTAANLGSVTPGTDYLCIVTLDPATNVAKYWKNTVSGTGVTPSYPAATTNADEIARIGARFSNTTGKAPNGTILYSFAMGNEYLDDTKAAAIFAHMEARHARDYTP